ncbi:MAG: site-2 protease family protein [Fimbriimonadaceae bacterium]|nr:site-2 protease family protein [Fimbriimonadaceae bacterium]
MGDLSVLLNLVQGAFAFLATVVVLVAVHEYGHFITARWFGMKVNAFAVMVGGRRVTRLDGHLDRKLAPAWWLWALFGVAALASLLAPGTAGLVGLALAGLLVPVWVALRLERLYHLDAGTAARTLLMSAGGGVLLLLLGAGVRAPLGSWLGVLCAGVAVGLMILYYRPVLGKSEDSPQGVGQIHVNDEPVEVRFRPLLARKDNHGTEFSLLMLPLGGFAAIHGMHAREDGGETRIEGGFYSRPPWQRLVVLFAGPLFSILFGVAILTAVFSSVGRQIPDTGPVLGIVAQDGPAAKAGLREGDVVRSVGGTEIKRFFDIVGAVRDRTDGSPIPIVVERGGKRMEFSVLPEVDKKPSVVMGSDLMPTRETRIQAKLMVGPKAVLRVSTFTEALGLAVRQPVDMALGLASLAAKPQRATEDLGGPAMIATQSAEASKQGILGSITFAALLSMSFGVLNLLPISPLDGGQMMVALVELLRGGRRLTFKTQTLVANVSFLLIGLLILTVLTSDIRRFANAGAQGAAQEQSR